MTFDAADLAKEFFELQSEGSLPEAPGLWSFEELRLELLASEARTFRWLDDSGSLAGFVIYRNVLGEAEIMQLAIRRKGAGRSRIFLAAFVDHLRQVSLDIASLWLEVSVRNVAALALYRRAGFHESGRRPNYYRNGDDALLMKLELTSLGK